MDAARSFASPAADEPPEKGMPLGEVSHEKLPHSTKLLCDDFDILVYRLFKPSAIDGLGLVEKRVRILSVSTLGGAIISGRQWDRLYPCSTAGLPLIVKRSRHVWARMQSTTPHQQ